MQVLLRGEISRATIAGVRLFLSNDRFEPKVDQISGIFWDQNETKMSHPQAMNRTTSFAICLAPGATNLKKKLLTIFTLGITLAVECRLNEIPQNSFA